MLNNTFSLTKFSLLFKLFLLATLPFILLRNIITFGLNNMSSIIKIILFLKYKVMFIINCNLLFYKLILYIIFK